MTITTTTKRLRVLTNSEIRTYRRCPREHHYAYVEGYRPVEDAEALRFGTMIHRGLELLWSGAYLSNAILAACEGAADEYEAAKARVLLIGYVERWGAEYLTEVVAVEREFRAPLVNPETGAASRTYQLGGKLDVLLRDRFVEHKTSSEDIGPGSVYWRRLQLDSQVSTYYAGARALGHDVRGCIYDVIRKPALRPSAVPLTDESGTKIVHDASGARVRTKDGKKWRETSDTAAGYVLQTRPETPDEYAARLAADVAARPDAYYQRGEVVRLQAEELEAQADAWQVARAMRDAELAGFAPRNADACQRHGRMCSYFDVCTGVARLDDPTRFERLEHVHAELTPDATEAA